MVRVPVEPVDTEPPPIATSCTATAVVPDGPVGARAPSGSSTRDGYADGLGTTGSLYVIVIVLPAVMRADTMAGGWASSTCACTDPPMGLPSSSRIMLSSTVSVPDAPVGAVGANWTVWLIERPGSEGSPGLRVPSDPRSSVPYAPAAQATGSLYVILIVLFPVRAADSITGAMPSAISSEAMAVGLLPAKSSTEPSFCR